MSSSGRRMYAVEGDQSVSGDLIVGGDITVRGNVNVEHSRLDKVVSPGSGGEGSGGTGEGSGEVSGDSDCGAWRDITIWSVLDKNDVVKVHAGSFSGASSQGKVVFGMTADGWSFLLKVGSESGSGGLSGGLSVEGSDTGVTYFSLFPDWEKYGVRSGNLIRPFIKTFYRAIEDKALYYLDVSDVSDPWRLQAIGDPEVRRLKILLQNQSQRLSGWQERVRNVLGVDPDDYSGESLYDLVRSESDTGSSMNVDDYGRLLVFDGFLNEGVYEAESGTESGRSETMGIYFSRQTGTFFMCARNYQMSAEIRYNVWRGSVHYGTLLNYESTEFEGLEYCVGLEPKERGCVFLNSRTGKMYEGVRRNGVMTLELLGE